MQKAAWTWNERRKCLPDYEMSFQIKYSRGRHPVQQRREDGTWGCRGCGGEIPKGRQTWCSKACLKTWHPTFVLIEVRKRDHDVCSMCSFDMRKAKEEYYAILRRRWDGEDLPAPEKPHKPNYDHIKPFSEGGLTVLENIRTLCEPCHKKRTKEWHGERKAQRS